MKKQHACSEEVEDAVFHYSRMLVKIAFTYLKSMQDAEDVVQDVFIIYLTKSPKFSSEEHRRNWLVRCTINKCKDLLRMAWYKNWLPMPEGLMSEKPEELGILQLIWQLEPKYRIPLYLHYCEGYSLNEIAVMMNKKISTVGTWLARARKKLEMMMGENDELHVQ